MSISSAVLTLATRHGGYVTRQQLVDAGMSTSAIDRRIAAGEFHLVTQGLYQVLPSRGHVDQLRGAVLHLPGAVVSHESAAHLLSFPCLPVLVPTVTVPAHTTHVFPGVTVRRANDLDPGDLTTVDRLRVTNVVRTAFDLAGVLSYEDFEEVVEALVRDERMHQRHLARLTDRLGRRGKRGATAARRFLDDWAGTSGTVLERRGRALLVAAGLPVPVAEYPIPWDPRRRFDDAYPDWMVAIEWDSRAWHSQQTAMDRDRSRDRAAALHGWTVVRFTWRDVNERPDLVASTVASLLKSCPASPEGSGLAYPGFVAPLIGVSGPRFGIGGLRWRTQGSWPR